MKKHVVNLALVFLLIMIAGQQVSAAAPEWEFDTAHSRFYFSINHIFSKVIGHFDDYSGIFRFDPENPGESMIEVEIKTNSINTNIQKRDNHLRSDDFFSVKKYPLITFESKRITRTEEGMFEVEGDLTIKDVTKRVVLVMTYFGTRENPLKPGELVAGFETRVTIDRLDYHVGSGKFHQMGVVGKDVDITVSLEMLRKK